MGVALSYWAIWVLVAYFAAGLVWFAEVALFVSGPMSGIGAALAYRKPRQKIAMTLGILGLVCWVLLWVLLLFLSIPRKEYRAHCMVQLQASTASCSRRPAISIPLVVSFTVPTSRSAGKIMNTELKRQLLKMVEEDQRVRAELAATGELFEGYAPEMAEVHRHNAQNLEAMIEEYGWPGKSIVGEEGANAAWLILQHAIGHPELQRKCLPILREAVERGDAEPEHAAYLEDRIRFFERRPQRYGTHFDWDESGRMSPYLLEDPERVDEYRQAAGLSLLAERIEEARDNTEGEPKPSDLKKRENEMRKWAKSVGWL